MLRRSTLLSTHISAYIPRQSSAKASRVSTVFAAPMATLQRSPIFEAIQKHDANSTAVIHSASGRRFHYGSILHDVAAAKDHLLQATGKKEHGIAGERVAFLIENGYDYVGTRLTLPLSVDPMSLHMSFFSHSPGHHGLQRHSSASCAVFPRI